MKNKNIAIIFIVVMIALQFIGNIENILSGNIISALVVIIIMAIAIFSTLKLIARELEND